MVRLVNALSSLTIIGRFTFHFYAQDVEVVCVLSTRPTAEVSCISSPSVKNFSKISSV